MSADNQLQTALRGVLQEFAASTERISSSITALDSRLREQVQELRGEFTASANALERILSILADTSLLDHKTPLFNEVALMKHGDEALTDAQGSWTIFAGDVNDFKNLNSTIGTQRADLVLDAIGSNLERIAAQANGRGYRRGGDEFALLVPGTFRRQVTDTLERLFSNFAADIPFTPDERGKTERPSELVPVRMTFGSMDLGPGLTFRAVLHRAEEGSKAAKWMEGTVVVSWQEGLATGLSLRLRCPDPTCRSQVSLGVSPQKSTFLGMLHCMVCGAVLLDRA